MRCHPACTGACSDHASVADHVQTVANTSYDPSANNTKTVTSDQAFLAASAITSILEGKTWPRVARGIRKLSCDPRTSGYQADARLHSIGALTEGVRHDWILCESGG